MRNIAINGDFQGEAAGSQPLYILVAGTPGAGEVSSLSNANLVAGWTASGNFATMTGDAGGVHNGVLISTGAPGEARGLAKTTPVLTVLPPGSRALYVATAAGTTLTSGATSSLNITQTIANAPRAAGGKFCTLSFWYLVKNYGRFRSVIQQTVDGVTTVLDDSRMLISRPVFLGQWQHHRRQFQVPLLAPAAMVSAISLTVYFEDGTTSGLASIASTISVGLTGVYIGVPDGVPGQFDDAERILEPA